jgi:hypothetical protein
MKLMGYLIKMMTKTGGNQLKLLALIFFTCLKRAFLSPLPRRRVLDFHYN